MKYYLIAGEASGDLHASNLMKEIKRNDPDAEFRAWGGDLMQEQGAEIVKHYRDLAFMGFVEVLANIRTILGNMRFCKDDLLQWQPDVLILVDYPGFNLRIAEFAHQAGMKVVYYISPQVWAWKKSRVKQIRKYVDKMLVILPFEEDFYAQYHYPVEYVGHPLLDALGEMHFDEASFRAENKLGSKPVVALLPGSRKQEISTMLKVMLRVIPSFPKHQFVIAGAPSVDLEFYQKIIGNADVKLIQNKTRALLSMADAALVTSGTATLETALMNVPEVVCYKGSAISYQIAKRLIDIRFISLVNLIMDREVVKELIQYEFNAENLKKELDSLLNQRDKRDQMLTDFQSLRHVLGEGGASAKAASLVKEFLNQS